MATVVLENLVKTYPAKSGPGLKAVNGISLTVADREFMVLVGPSGCGKSTTLRMVAGLEEVGAGTVAIGGRVVNQVPPRDRDIAMVFQNYALYPHMSVYDNMAFGLKLRKFPAAEIDVRVREAAGLLGLESCLARRPKALSGGQRQRVAVGRAIVRKPSVFLFDEPLSNLDAQMRVSMRAEISRLHARLGATMIYVTHDQVEAMTMGDRICVMKEGDIMQVAEPLALYNEPANLFVAGFIGSPAMNFFRGTLRPAGDSVAFVEGGGATAPLQLTFGKPLAARAAGHLGEEVVLGVRPENISEAGPSAPPGSTADVRVDVAEPTGPETYLYLHTGTHPFIARVRPDVRCAAGGRIAAAFDLSRAHLFSARTGARMT